jgi:hypothetical protein
MGAPRALGLYPTPLEEATNGRLFLAEAGVRHFVHAVPVWSVGKRLRSLPVIPYLEAARLTGR